MIIRSIKELDESPPADIYLVYEGSISQPIGVCSNRGEVLTLFTYGTPGTYVKAYVELK